MSVCVLCAAFCTNFIGYWHASVADGGGIAGFLVEIEAKTGIEVASLGSWGLAAIESGAASERKVWNVRIVGVLCESLVNVRL